MSFTYHQCTTRVATGSAPCTLYIHALPQIGQTFGVWTMESFWRAGRFWLLHGGQDARCAAANHRRRDSLGESLATAIQATELRHQQREGDVRQEVEQGLHATSWACSAAAM